MARDKGNCRFFLASPASCWLEDRDGTNPESRDKELGLEKTVDAMVLNIESSAIYPEDQRSHEYEKECREKYATVMTDVGSREVAENDGTAESPHAEKSSDHNANNESGSRVPEEPVEEGAKLSRHRKLKICYELLSACIGNNYAENDEKSPARKGYDARHRAALRLLATWLVVQWIEMEALEMMVACSIMTSIEGENAKEEEREASGGMSDRWKRGTMIGAAALTGGTLMAITGGLAAPAIGQGLGALAPTMGSLIPAVGAGGFTAAATATGSAAGSVAVAASFGAAGAGLSGCKMAKRIGELEEFEFNEIGKNNNQGWLAVEILISGLAFEVEDFVRPWEGHDQNLERYALQWESKNLIALSTAVQDWLTSRIALQLMKQGGMMTVLSSLMTALAAPATLVMASDLIDSKWAVGIDRSDKAGILLAEVLLKGLQGNRPVTLIGFSLGARVIFKCLSYLAEAGEDNACLVERVVLLGAPIPIKDESWEIARKMVAGRFVNAYSRNDWTLGIVCRASMLSQGLAGIQQVDFPGIENVDVTRYIKGHSSYLWMTKQILNQLELDNPHPVFRTANTEIHQPKNSPP
ncbi:transmembrane and coiled-coil domain-containing protein 4-like isoform X2 [Punica granatum]|uniref:Transmembrane and coiled-coil domain-containing protein 4-like isoform X2 n=1 Tax=Punica granatum TaxID=22663 RepID=A0A6P8ELK8_PUNGR|nr:transmembrane and coiled-coil domain-containing protein 4-like isoform X2 [Punica granatum]